jgi:hypothetical protein
MPVTFRQIAAKTAKVTLSLEDKTITIIYYPNKYTDEIIAKSQAGEITDKEFFPLLIKEWDIYEDEEYTVMFPIERIDEFGIAFKREVAEAIARNMRPNLLTPQMNGNK